MLKRLLDDKIRSRLSNAIDNEIMLRILTLNLMILLLIALQRVLNKAGYIPHTDHTCPPDISFANYCYYLKRLAQICGKT
jgi:uroporphyrinogen decarboxylase